MTEPPEMSSFFAIPLWICLIAAAEKGPTASTIEIDRSELTLERIFDSGEFQSQDVAIRWSSTGSTYEVLEGTRTVDRNSSSTRSPQASGK